MRSREVASGVVMVVVAVVVVVVDVVVVVVVGLGKTVRWWVRSMDGSDVT